MKILLCTDGSETADKALNYAVQFAENFGADLTLVYVIQHGTSMEKPVYDNYGEMTHKAKEVLEDAQKKVSQFASGIHVQDRIAVGPISTEIVRIAEDEGFEMIVLGTRGLTGLKRMLLGSVAEDVINLAHCPVTVVR